MTTGVAMPSLRPLSTLISRRIREGTAGLVTTGTPSAASVGASAAPISSASHMPSPGNSQAASPQPAAMVSGRPTASRRSTRPASERRSWIRNARRVGEQHPDEGDLDQRLEASPAPGRRPRPAGGPAPPRPPRTRSGAQVRPLQSGRQHAPQEDRCGDDEDAGRAHGRLPTFGGGVLRPRRHHRGSLRSVGRQTRSRRHAPPHALRATRALVGDDATPPAARLHRARRLAPALARRRVDEPRPVGPDDRLGAVSHARAWPGCSSRGS